jgi:hypothetical protein
MKYSKGIMWLDDCRIPFVDVTENTKRSISGHQKVYGSGAEIHYLINTDTQQDRDKGRFTPNLLVCDDMLNDGSITNSSGHIRNNTKTQTIYGGGKGFPPIKVDTAPNDKGTNSRYYDLDKWFDKIIDSL